MARQRAGLVVFVRCLGTLLFFRRSAFAPLEKEHAFPADTTCSALEPVQAARGVWNDWRQRAPHVVHGLAARPWWWARGRAMPGVPPAQAQLVPCGAPVRLTRAIKVSETLRQQSAPAQSLFYAWRPSPPPRPGGGLGAGAGGGVPEHPSGGKGGRCARQQGALPRRPRGACRAAAGTVAQAALVPLGAGAPRRAHRHAGAPSPRSV